MKNKKAFTIVELVIVIAIIAILAAVLIPTFASIIMKANISRDTQLVRNLNTALIADRASSNYAKHRTMHEAVEAVEASGLSIDSIKASYSGNEILWDQTNDAFCYVQDGNLEYVPTSAKEVSVPFTDANKHLFWKIYDEMPAGQTYSIYWNGAGVTSFDVKVGFDDGEADGVAEVNYVGADFVKKNVVIRTNADTANLSVTVFNGVSDCDTVYHYDKAGTVTIIDSGSSSYHELGDVARIDANKGHVVVEAGAKVTTVVSYDGDKVVLDNNGGEIISACGEGHTTNTGNVSLDPFIADEVDMRFIAKLNESLSGTDHANMTEALDAVAASGYGINRIVPVVAGHDILWDQANDVFCYFDGTDILYVEPVGTSFGVGDYHLWKIYDEMPENQTYSIYWNGAGVTLFDNLAVGFDAGVRAKAITVKYVGNTTAKDDVIVRTIGGTLVLNNANDTVNHFGEADAVLNRAGTYVACANAVAHANFDPTTIIGSRYTSSPNRTDRMQLQEKGIELKAHTIVQLVDTTYDYQIGKLSKSGDNYTHVNWVSPDWKTSSNGSTCEIQEDGYYVFNFRNSSNTSLNLTSTVNTFRLEDVIRISYFGGETALKQSKVQTSSNDLFYGYARVAPLFDDYNYSSQQSITWPASNNGQDGYIYDGKVIILTSNSTSGKLKVYNLVTGESLGDITLDKYSSYKAHGNSVQYRIVDNELYTYANIYNAYGNGQRCGECCVYRTDLDNMTTELVQVIKVDGVTGWPEWKPNVFEAQQRPYGNFAIDTENNVLYAYVMNMTDLSASVDLTDISVNNTKWFKFELPDITDGVATENGPNVVTLTNDDLKDEWITEYMQIMQGVTVQNGLIWTIEGTTNAWSDILGKADSGRNEATLRVINPDNHTELMKFSFNFVNSYHIGEPEFITFYEGTFFYGTGKTMFTVSLK